MKRHHISRFPLIAVAVAAARGRGGPGGGDGGFGGDRHDFGPHPALLDLADGDSDARDLSGFPVQPAGRPGAGIGAGEDHEGGIAAGIEGGVEPIEHRGHRHDRAHQRREPADQEPAHPATPHRNQQ